MHLVARKPPACHTVNARFYSCLLIMIKIFISYRRSESAALATLIAKSLQTVEIDAYVDTRSSDAGGEFAERLHKAIENCDIFVPLLGKTTLDSEWVLNEIEHAHNLRKPMIPVFQESFVTPAPPQNEDVAALLGHDGVHIFDIKNLYMDEAIARLAQMIRNAAHPAQGGAFAAQPPAEPRRSAKLRALSPATIAILVALIGAAATIIAALISPNGGQGAAALPTTMATIAVPTEAFVPTATPAATATMPPTSTPTDTSTNTPTQTPTVTPTITPTNQPTATPTSKATQPLTATFTPVPPTPTPAPTLDINATLAVLAVQQTQLVMQAAQVTSTPTATPTVVQRGYPCEASVVIRGSDATSIGGQVYSQPRSNSTPLSMQLVVGQRFTIRRDQTTSGTLWYQIGGSSGSIIGWMTGQYLELSSTCPD